MLPSRHLRPLALTLFAAALAAWGVSAAGAQPAQPQPLQAGMPAPELDNGTDWLGVKEPLTLKDLRGKFVILDFWTLC